MGKDAREKADRTIPTFGQFADEYIAAHRPKFRNDKHAAQWEMTLGDAYCKAIRHLPVDAVDTEAILKVLQPIWQKVPETASRLRGRIENVLDAAKARGFRSGENPATWRGHLKPFSRPLDAAKARGFRSGENPATWSGHLKTLLPARQRLTRGHHAALPYDDLPPSWRNSGPRHPPPRLP